MSCFVWKCREKQFFCGNDILAKFVFVTQLFSDAGILVWGFMWVVTKCCFISDKLSKVSVCTVKACCSPNFSITWGGSGRVQGPVALPLRMNPSTHLLWGGGWVGSWMFGSFGREINLLPLTEMEPWFFDFPATSQVMCHTHHAVSAPI